MSYYYPTKWHFNNLICGVLNYQFFFSEEMKNKEIQKRQGMKREKNRKQKWKGSDNNQET